MQYSMRLTETISAEQELMKISARLESLSTRDHALGDRLGEEERAAQIDAENDVEIVRRRLHEVEPLRRCNAGIRHQHIDGAERRLDGVEDARVIGHRADVAGDERGGAAMRGRAWRPPPWRPRRHACR